MNILVSGCSFTQNSHSWANILKEHDWTGLLKDNDEIYVHNYGYPGAGNKYIADSVMLQDLDNIDIVVVMWSGLSRLDAIIGNNHNCFDDYYFKNTIKNLKYIFSGGQIGRWQFYTFTKMLFKNQYKFSNNESLATLSLLEMIKLQSYLKSKNKKYIFSSYVNYWNAEKDWTTRNCDFSLKYTDNVQHLIDKIDFTQWLFLNDKKDGIYEYGLEHNLLENDGFHPKLDANKFWSGLVFNKIKEQLNVNQ